MNSGITRGGLSRNFPNPRSAGTVRKKKQKRGENLDFFLPLHPLDLKSHGKKNNNEKKLEFLWL